MTPRTPRLFDVDKRALKPVPQMHLKLQYRLAKGGPEAKYTPYRSKRGTPCDCCFGLQHEGLDAVRSSARVKRTHPTAGEFLLLCRSHAESWRERDRLDLGRKR